MKSLPYLLLLALASSLGESSLLDMSQVLWSRVLDGGYRKLGKLDPLRVPVVKVDQTEGNTSYRVILRNLEISGLNDSRIESVQIFRGKLKSNLSDNEAGYVSYNEQRDLDSVRYRFHTLVKEPKSQNKDEERRTNEEFERIMEFDPLRTRAREEEEEENIEVGLLRRDDNSDKRANAQGAFGDVRVAMDPAVKNPTRMRVLFNGRPCIGACKTFDRATTANPSEESSSAQSLPEEQRRNVFALRSGDSEIKYDGRLSADVKGARISAESRGENPGDRDEVKGGRGRQGSASFYAGQTGNVKGASIDAAGASLRFSKGPEPSGLVEEFKPYKSPVVRLEQQPGYVDIVYAKQDKPRSEQLRAPAPEDDPRTVELLEQIMKDLRNNQRYIIHNFTEGEALSKRNDAARVASETKRIKDLIRYAKEYQEKEGYYEEGMELVYHFGNSNENASRANETLTRRKRQHVDSDKDEEDLMHVVVRIRAPMLRVKSAYALTGKVGRRQVRGGGLLTGNFTEVTGDFTVELKRVSNETMIVRAARAKLVAKERSVKLEGMDEKGPVDSIIAHGLMAAEAVAAMIADDLASKALSEGTAESMIYKMYKNLPIIERA